MRNRIVADESRAIRRGIVIPTWARDWTSARASQVFVIEINEVSHGARAFLAYFNPIPVSNALRASRCLSRFRAAFLLAAAVRKSDDRSTGATFLFYEESRYVEARHHRTRALLFSPKFTIVIYV